MNNITKYKTDVVNVIDHFDTNTATGRFEKNKGHFSNIPISYSILNKFQSWNRTGDNDGWLKDQHIDFYMNILREQNIKARASNNEVPCCYTCPSFLWASIKRANVGDKTLPERQTLFRETIRQFLLPKGRRNREGTKQRGLDHILQADLILLPVSVNASHWILLAIDTKHNTFNAYDSYKAGGKKRSREMKELILLREFYTEMCRFFNENTNGDLAEEIGMGDQEVQAMAAARCGQNIDAWSLHNRSCPQQNNAFDCGVFVSQCARFIVSNLNTGTYDFDFRQQDMQHLRCRMCMDIMNRLVIKDWAASFTNGFGFENRDVVEYDIHATGKQVGTLLESNQNNTRLIFRIEWYNPDTELFALKQGKVDASGRYTWYTYNNNYEEDPNMSVYPMHKSVEEINALMSDSTWTDCTPVLEEHTRFIQRPVVLSPLCRSNHSTNMKRKLAKNFEQIEPISLNYIDDDDDDDDDGDSTGVEYFTEYFGSGVGSSKNDRDLIQRMQEAAGRVGLSELYTKPTTTDNATETEHVLHDWQRDTSNLVSWKREKYFFSKCFPFTFMPAEVFIDGKKEWDVPTDWFCNIARNKKNSFGEYCQHLTKINPRFMAHPILKFVLLNIKNKEALFSQINYMVSILFC